MGARRPLVRVNGRIAALPSGDTIDKASVGLGNVDNTADAKKPVSAAQQDALNLKADKTALTFSKEYVVDTTYTNGGAITLSHGLGVVPKFVQFQAVCITDEGGWSAGLVADLSHEIQFAGSLSNSVGLGAAFNDATVFVRIAAAGLYTINYGNFQAFALTPTSWRLRIRVFA